MRFAGVAVLALACAVRVSGAQAPASPAAQPPRPEPAKTEAPVAEAQPPVLRNTGKPIVVPFQCSDDDIQWAGMSCTEDDPCSVYFEISSIEVVGNRVIAAGDIHSEATTLYSVLLVSEDAGETWREAYERLRGAGLDHIQFNDFQNGWLSGGYLVPVARDPFLLITSDGGKTWRLRAVFSEGGGGAIQQFWFDSATSGSLVIDRMESAESSRYELYSTPNGGETWMIRRTSDEPVAKLHPGGEDERAWRLRADAGTKSFVIEKHQANRWAAMASFLIEIGNCKPAPRVPVKEPTEEALPPAVTPPPEGQLPGAPPPPPSKPPKPPRP